MPTKGDNPFGALAGLRGQLPRALVKPAAEPPTPPNALAGKIVVSKSRKGRGGRTVTIVAGIRGDDVARDTLCRELKKALGCGASIEGDKLIVSGDISDRIAEWLEKRGAKKVIRGT
jgi:translation initiation factor 1